MRIKYDHVLLFFIACGVIAAILVLVLTVFFPCSCEYKCAWDMVTSSCMAVG